MFTPFLVILKSTPRTELHNRYRLREAARLPTQIYIRIFFCLLNSIFVLLGEFHFNTRTCLYEFNDRFEHIIIVWKRHPPAEDWWSNSPFCIHDSFHLKSALIARASSHRHTINPPSPNWILPIMNCSVVQPIQFIRLDLRNLTGPGDCQMREYVRLISPRSCKVLVPR